VLRSPAGPAAAIPLLDHPIDDGKPGRCSGRPSILAVPRPLHPERENSALLQPLPGAANSGATFNLRFVTILPNDAPTLVLTRRKDVEPLYGLSLGPPLDDQRLDLCDLYAFQSPTDRSRTVIILNANPNADALHPDAIYRLNIDNDGDLLTDIALSYVFSKPQNGKQTFNEFLAKGAESRSVEAVGKKIVADAEVSFDPKPNLVKAGDYTFFAGSRSDAFFFDFAGIRNLFDIRGKRNFTEPHLSGKSPWTGVDSNTEANVFSMVVELPTSELPPKPEVHIWGRCSVREDGKLIHADRAGHPSVSSFFNTDDTKLEYNASEPVSDRTRWLDQFVHLMGHTGNYSREEALPRSTGSQHYPTC
jgi:hypothetical protein